jgi:branched-chain amino acid transport system permease protein
MRSGLQLLVNGFASGCATALLAVAFQLVYLPTGVFFVAIAAIYAVAPFLLMSAVSRGIPVWLGIAFSVTTCAVLALLTEWASHGRLSKLGASSTVHLIASLGNYILLVQLIAIVWGNNPFTIRAGLDTTAHVGTVVVTGTQLTMMVVALIVLGGMFLLLLRSNIGLRLRALAENPMHFALCGFNANSYRLIAFGLSGSLAATASLVTANDVGFNANSGLSPFLVAVVAVITAGRRSLIAPVVGALILGILRAQVAWVWSSRWQDAVTFGLLVVVLLIWPEGVLAGKSRVEAST